MPSRSPGPVYGIVPPHVLRHLARHGDDDHRAIALDTLARSKGFDTTLSAASSA